MTDPRKPRRYYPPTLSILIVDSNRFNRGLLADIARAVGVMKIEAAENEKEAFSALSAGQIDIIIGDWNAANEVDIARFTRTLRGLPDDRTRRLPLIAVISETTKDTIIQGRDAGVDEFLAKPIAPKALESRMSMVIKTPRPFVDSSVYVGPCRRRKNPADYYGPKRRGADAVKDPCEPEACNAPDKDNPLIAAVARIKSAVEAGEARELAAAIIAARQSAADANDIHVARALQAFSGYIKKANKAGGADPGIVQTTLSALSQLTVLPIEMHGPRETVSSAVSAALQHKTAA